jgi:hypothetical protein
MEHVNLGGNLLIDVNVGLREMCVVLLYGYLDVEI